MNCRLCSCEHTAALDRDKKRSYYFCPECHLIFVSESEFLSYEKEKERYDFHENTTDNEGYVGFLKELIPVIKNVGLKDPEILDFGSGKNAVLSSLLQHSDLKCESYDPLYDIHPDDWEKKYDIIVLCEVIEHLRDLKTELKLIKSILSDSGSVIIRTKLYPPVDKFLKWWYIQDPTHINFFSRKTVCKVAEIIQGIYEETKLPDVFIIRLQS